MSSYHTSMVWSKPNVSKSTSYSLMAVNQFSIFSKRGTLFHFFCRFATKMTSDGFLLTLDFFLLLFIHLCFKFSLCNNKTIVKIISFILSINYIRLLLHVFFLFLAAYVHSGGFEKQNTQTWRLSRVFVFCLRGFGNCGWVVWERKHVSKIWDF